jgi:hypothetical protein
VKDRISNFLNQAQLHDEFSHTVLHGKVHNAVIAPGNEYHYKLFCYNHHHFMFRLRSKSNSCVTISAASDIVPKLYTCKLSGAQQLNIDHTDTQTMPHVT